MPWNFGFTFEAREKLVRHYGTEDLDGLLHNHLYSAPGADGPEYWTALGNDCWRDYFGVVWDRSVDKDIGNVQGKVLPEPTLHGYAFPNPLDPRIFEDIPGRPRAIRTGLGSSAWGSRSMSGPGRCAAWKPS